MVKPAEDRVSTNDSDLLNRTKTRRILVQRPMRSDGVVVSGIGNANPAQMCLARIKRPPKRKACPRLVKHLDLLSSPAHRPMELRGIIPFGGDEELRICLQLATIQDTSIRTVSTPTPTIDQDRAEASRHATGLSLNPPNLFEPPCKARVICKPVFQHRQFLPEERQRQKRLNIGLSDLPDRRRKETVHL